MFKKNPKVVQRLFFDDTTAARMAVWCGYLSGARKFFRKVSPKELERIAATVHHGGVTAITRRPPPAAPMQRDVQLWRRRGKPILLLDRIGNPHNLGAIVRSAAFFGVPTVVVPEHPEQALPSPAVYRVAEGGMEYVDFYVVRSLVDFCRQLAHDFFLVGTDVHRGEEVDLRQRAGTPEMPLALVLGNEETGLTPDVAAACRRLIRVPGTGAVESLNVSAAAAVLLAWVAGDRPVKAAGR